MVLHPLPKVFDPEGVGHGPVHDPVLVVVHPSVKETGTETLLVGQCDPESAWRPTELRWSRVG